MLRYNRSNGMITLMIGCDVGLGMEVHLYIIS